uniref:Aha1_N domain-containing protein n=1 Tax=Globodera pallida TaxID=36090 RepID=A0A183C2D2_GLOPA
MRSGIRCRRALCPPAGVFVFTTLFIVTLTLPGTGKARPIRMQLMRMDAQKFDEMLRYLQVEESNEKTAVKGGDETKIEEASNSASSPPFPMLPLEEKSAEWNSVDLSSPFHSKESKIKKSEQYNNNDNKIMHFCENSAERRQWEMKVRHFLHSQFQHIWSDHFGVEVLGIKLNVHSIRIRHIHLPKIRVETSCATFVSGGDLQTPTKVTVSGGSLSLLAEYRSTYRTVRAGHLRVRLRGFAIEWVPNGKNDADYAQKCGEAVRHAQVRFRPRLLQEMDEAVDAHLRARAAHLLCARLDRFIRLELPKWPL